MNMNMNGAEPEVTAQAAPQPFTCKADADRPAERAFTTR